MRPLLRLLISAVIVALAGCGSSELYTLEGNVAFQDASDFRFSGDVLELRLKGNPLQRAFAQIEPDGAFRIETLEDGKVASGAKPGVYEARIVISDDDPQHVKLASKAIHRKFTRFETSGLTIEVPSPHVVLRIAAR